MRSVLLGFLLLFAVLPSVGQTQENIKLSGVVIDADSLMPVQLVNIYGKKRQVGAVSKADGSFEFIAQAGDTIVFSCVGYFKSEFVMPKGLKKEAYTLIQLMRKETIVLSEVVVFPWPDLETFQKSILSTNPPPSQFEKDQNLNQNYAQDILLVHEQEKYNYDTYSNYKLYNLTGIIAPNNFINPINWTDFIRDLKKK